MARARPLTDGGAKCRQAIAYVRTLKGTVISPDDPTILIEAGRAPSRSVFADEDAFVWPRQLPPAVTRDISRADYLVHDAGWWRQWLSPQIIASLGYSMHWSNGEYSVWQGGARERVN